MQSKTSTGKVFVEISLRDPLNLSEEGYPQEVIRVYLTLNRGWMELWHDLSKPQSLLINDAIASVTLDPAEAEKLQGARGSFLLGNCAYCGGGLEANRCFNCGKSYRYDASWSPWCTPLPPKVVRVLEEHGHEFGTHPVVARKRESLRSIILGSGST